MVGFDMYLLKIVEMFECRYIKCVLVVSDGFVVGIVSCVNLLYVFVMEYKRLE